MLCTIVEDKAPWDNILKVVDLGDPVCGKDFCDACGDCLACYGDDPCGQYGEDGHYWVKYETL